MRRAIALPTASEAATPRSAPYVARETRRGALGHVGCLEVACLGGLAGASVLLNAPGTPARLIASAVILFVVAAGTLAILSGSRAAGGLLSYFPAVAFTLGLLAFHFSWGAGTRPEWLLYLGDDESVAYALLLAAAAILAVAAGSRLAGAAPATRALSAASTGSARSAPAALLVVVGLASGLWALLNGYVGFATGAFGLGQAAVAAPLTPTILALYSLLGVGQTGLLVLLLDDLRATAPRFGGRARLLLSAAILASFGLDTLFRLQSASRATMLGGLVPLLITVHAFGYRKAPVVAGGVVLVAYLFVVYPLASALRYDEAYGRQLEAGGLAIPQLAYVWDAIADTSGASPSDAVSRLNQTSLLAFAVERQGEGLDLLSGESYAYAAATLVPRVLVPDRADSQIEYDFYTGYSTAFRGYNNWGIHTEAYLNFGPLGVIAVMAAVGYVWQKVYSLLTRVAYPFGWAIAAAVLLPTVLRAGEYNFLATIVSPTKTLLLALVFCWGAMPLARRALPTSTRQLDPPARRP